MLNELVWTYNPNILVENFSTWDFLNMMTNHFHKNTMIIFVKLMMTTSIKLFFSWWKLYQNPARVRRYQTWIIDELVRRQWSDWQVAIGDRRVNNEAELLKNSKDNRCPLRAAVGEREANVQWQVERVNNAGREPIVSRWWFKGRQWELNSPLKRRPDRRPFNPRGGATPWVTCGASAEVFTCVFSSSVCGRSHFLSE